MTVLLEFLFWCHDLAGVFLAKHLFTIKKLILIVAHLALFGFFFPDVRKDFGEIAFYLLFALLFLSPLSRIFRTRLLLQAMSLRRELGIAMAYLATVHGLGYLLDPQWFALLVAPSLAESLWSVDPGILAGATTYLLTLPLLFTSNTLAQRFLGRRWKTLHRVVYVVFALALFHQYLMKGAGPGELFQASALFSTYLFAKLLAWHNFLPPLRNLIDLVALRYREYTIRLKATIVSSRT